MTRFRKGIAALQHELLDILPEAAKAERQGRHQGLRAKGVPDVLAERFASLPWLSASPDCVLIAETSQRSLKEAAIAFFGARDLFKLDSLRESAQQIITQDEFERLALGRALSSFAEAERSIALAMLATGKAGLEAVSSWAERHQERVDRSRAMIAEMAMGGLTLSKLTVAAGLLGDLARS